MHTEAQIEEQILLEREQIRQGLERLRDNTVKLQDKEYASASVYGVSSIEELLPKVIQQIKDTAARAKRGFVGVDFAHIKQYLADRDIPLHPVYKYLPRFSCQVCIFNTPKELQAIRRNNPNAFYKIADLEKRIGHTMFLLNQFPENDVFEM